MNVQRMKSFLSEMDEKFKVAFAIIEQEKNAFEGCGTGGKGNCLASKQVVKIETYLSALQCFCDHMLASPSHRNQRQRLYTKIQEIRFRKIEAEKGITCAKVQGSINDMFDRIHTTE